MTHCKRSIIAACLLYMLPFGAWSEAPVVDDSENFAMLGDQQGSGASVVNPKYDDPLIENAELDAPRGEEFAMDTTEPYDGPALVKEDQSSNSVNASAKLIDRIQSLQKEVQELRGQLEVQAHDLKLLQQQQVAFYKDLDSRISGNTGSAAKSVQNKPSTDLSLGSATPAQHKPTQLSQAKPAQPVAAPIVIPTASRGNPADEQISYLAAYELIKNKRFDDATVAMETFVQKYPKGGYTANAEYWLGELYLVRREYQKSIDHFEVVLQQFPSSSKSAASLLKSAYAFAAKGDKQEAKNRFEQVVKTYPGTPTAKLASTKLQSINTL